MRRPLDVRRFLYLFIVCASTFACLPALSGARAWATPALTMDVATGDVLYQEDATQPWYPASTTKLMTVYVALSAVRDRQIAMNTPLVVSARAHKMPPSKMGFPVGTQVTLENALKMLMVRSANDVAITVAEGIAGSVEAFADDMNQSAAQLGMRETHFVNPNGLPSPDHVSSARDMAILARALYTRFPEHAGLFNLGELSLGNELIPNHNNLLGRYPGVDGMKTGFTCAAGFNIVASAYRDGRRLVVIVFGAPSVATRSEKVVALFDRGFAGVDKPIASIVALPSLGGGAPDMHDRVCRNRAGLIAAFNSQVEQLDAPLASSTSSLGLPALNPEAAFLFEAKKSPDEQPMATRINSLPPPMFDPVPVNIGADVGYAGVVAQARAPHTPIGTETEPVTAEAYAAAPAGTPIKGIAGSPLAIDPTALPLRGRRIRTARSRRGGAVMRAAAEAPTTKVLAGSNAKDGGGAAGERPVASAQKELGKSAKKQTPPKRLGVDQAKGSIAPRQKVARAPQPKVAVTKTTEKKEPEKKAPAKKAVQTKAGAAKAKPRVNASR